MHRFIYPVVLPADPSQPLEAATKQYVDANAATSGGSTYGSVGTWTFDGIKTDSSTNPGNGKMYHVNTLITGTNGFSYYKRELVISRYDAEGIDRALQIYNMDMGDKLSLWTDYGNFDGTADRTTVLNWDQQGSDPNLYWVIQTGSDINFDEGSTVSMQIEYITDYPGYAGAGGLNGYWFDADLTDVVNNPVPTGYCGFSEDISTPSSAPTAAIFAISTYNRAGEFNGAALRGLLPGDIIVMRSGISDDDSKGIRITVTGSPGRTSTDTWTVPVLISPPPVGFAYGGGRVNLLISAANTNLSPQGGGIGTITSTLIPNNSQTTLTLTHSYQNNIQQVGNSLTITKGGWWMISARAVLSGSVGNSRSFMCVTVGGNEFRSAIGYGEDFGNVTAMAKLAPSSSITLNIYQSSGVPLTANSGTWHLKYLGDE